MFEKAFAVFLVLILAAGLAFAVPAIPHQFYGNVTVNGASAHNANIVAKISGTEVASTSSNNGTYGYYPYIFLIPDPNNSNAGKTIEFYLNGTKVAEQVYENGGYTQLNLSIGESPPSPEPEPTSGGGGGEGGSGGSTASITLLVEGECTGNSIKANAKIGSSPASSAEITASFNGKEVGKKNTDSEGNASFSFDAIGIYSFKAKKGSAVSSAKSIELKDCTATEGEEGESGVIGTGVSCTELNCNDSNPCTIDSCTEGVCVYENEVDGTQCENNGTCQEGKCIGQSSGFDFGNLFGFFALGTESIIAGIVVIILIAVVLFFWKRKKKK